jgi:hypothetical protein
MSQTSIVTKIWYRGGWCNVNLDKAPKDYRQLRSFLLHNMVNPIRVSKADNEWWYLTESGIFKHVARTLYQLSLSEWLLTILKFNNEKN